MGYLPARPLTGTATHIIRTGKEPMNTTTDASPEALRAQMVERILADQSLIPATEAALRRVERHCYVPDVPLTDAYNEQAVITHTFPDGTHLSCASGPSIVAGMLNALDVHPGQRKPCVVIAPAKEL